MNANKRFEQAHIKVAFSLRLSKTQANILLRVDDFLSFESAPVASVKALEVRGLIVLRRDKIGKAVYVHKTTEAGALVAQLLRMAGMTVANTNPASVLKH